MTDPAKNSDLVAAWDVPLYDGNHRIEFEHGTTTGRRVIRVDNEVIYRKDWMFKLVGIETFDIKVGSEQIARCEIQINAGTGFTYEYVLLVNGKQFNSFNEKQSKIMQTWHHRLSASNEEWRIVLEKDTLDVWVNGDRKQTTHEFAEEGTEMHFELDDNTAHHGCIRTVSSGNKKQGIKYLLFIDEQEIPEEAQPQ